MQKNHPLKINLSEQITIETFVAIIRRRAEGYGFLSKNGTCFILGDDPLDKLLNQIGINDRVQSVIKA